TVTLEMASNFSSGQQLTLGTKGVTDISPNANSSNGSAPITLLEPSYALPEVQTATATGRGFVAANQRQLPTAADAKWTINAFVYMDQQPGDLSLIAGFGTGRDQGGAQRFLIKNEGHIYFWGSSIDIDSNVPFDLNRWQMVTISYDGTMVRIYKDGKEIKSEEASFADAAPLVRVGPPPAWRYGNRFAGKVAGLSIWNDALPADYIKALLTTGPK
ncbi:MAG TPA: LamG domain-containing protein, partial [Fimbriimonas sp.]|nr:LamG domain-containing protein [Fimbriimonas sp.]